MVMIDAATNPILLIAYHLWPDLYELHALAELRPPSRSKMDMRWILEHCLTFHMCVFARWILRSGRKIWSRSGTFPHWPSPPPSGSGGSS